MRLCWSLVWSMVRRVPPSGTAIPEPPASRSWGASVSASVPPPRVCINFFLFIICPVRFVVKLQPLVGGCFNLRHGFEFFYKKVAHLNPGRDKFGTCEKLHIVSAPGKIVRSGNVISFAFIESVAINLIGDEYSSIC